MRFKTVTVRIVMAVAGTAAADEHRAAAPDGAKADILSLADRRTVSSPVMILFGLESIGVAPAGSEVSNTGHRQLLIDTALDAFSLDEQLPATDKIRHFGGGQTQTQVELAPGEHTLRLLLGDWSHVPQDPPVLSDPVANTVE